ncbi:hypothetical protein HN777_00585 [Candidatus Woesearchaeota archaeon]|jgi:hypothetical protein|nr:hypothetical protein [Candidatus Woesearchaeota archaeon]
MIYKHSKETIEKMKKAHLGKRHSKETIEKMRKAQKGRTISESHRKKISEALTGKFMGKDNNFFGKKHTKKTKLQISKTKTGQKYSEEFCKRRSELTSGKNNPRFNNWSSKGKYDEKWDDKIKLKIKNRDNYECKNCNIYTKTGHVHHIDWNKKNTIEKNLIYLCVRCHNKSHAPTKKTNYIQKYKRMVIFK